jgi:hypothetical protein
MRFVKGEMKIPKTTVGNCNTRPTRDKKQNVNKSMVDIGVMRHGLCRQSRQKSEIRSRRDSIIPSKETLKSLQIIVSTEEYSGDFEF